MKNFFLSFFLLISLFVAKNSYGTHVMGAEFEYVAVGSDSFKIILYVYKDCKGIALTTQDISIDGVGFSYNTTLSSSIVTCKDVTNSCDTCTRCNPNKCGSYGYPSGANTNCSFAYGIEKATYEYLFVVPSNINSTYCKFRVSMSLCCRNGAITTCCAGENFYTYTEINRCLTVENSSPKFNKPQPGLVYSVGNCLVLNLGATDIDNDSLSYHMAPASNSYGSSCTYQGSYTYQYPLYYDGFPSVKTFNFKTCKGWLLDTNGDMFFKPMQQQVAQVAIAIREWRKINNVMTKISETVRDMEFIIVTKAANSIPVYMGSTSDVICAGRATSIEGHYIYDKDTKEQVTVNLAIKPAGSIDSYNQNANYTYWNLALQSQLSDTLKGFDSVQLNYNDNHCPQKYYGSRKYYINYQSCTTFPVQRKYTYLGCGIVECGAFPDSFAATILQYKWVIPGPAGVNIKAKKTQIYINKPWPYYITMMAKDSNSAIWQGYTDTLNFGDFFYADLGNDTTVCLNSSFTARAKLYNDTGTVKYYWNSDTVAGADSFTITVTKDTFIYVATTDSTGCTAYDSILVKIFKPQPNLLQSDYAACKGDSVLLYANNNIYNKILWGNNDTTDYIYTKATGQYYVTITDTIGCSQTFSTHVVIRNFPSGSDWVKDSTHIYGKLKSSSPSDPDLLCVGDMSYFEVTPPTGFTKSQYGTKWQFGSYLRIKTLNGYPAQGIWGSIPGDSSTNPKVYFIPRVGDKDSIYYIQLQVTDSTGLCDTMLYTYIKVIMAPAVSLGPDTMVCPFQQVRLSASCATSSIYLKYNWDNITTDSSYKYTVSDYKDTKHFVYITDSMGCRSYDDINVLMDTVTKVNLGPDKSYCPGSKVTLTVGNKKAGLKFKWNNGSTSSTNLVYPPGTYSVTVTNPSSGCVSYDTITLDTAKISLPGTAIDKYGALFHGKFNTGNASDPDYFCYGDSTVYQILAPTGYNSSDYGTKWTITGNPTINTQSGTAYPTSSYTFSQGTSSVPPLIQIRSNAKFADSLLLILITVADLNTLCDTTIGRDIIMSYPKLALNADTANVCNGQSYTFKATPIGGKAPYIILWNGVTKSDTFVVKQATSKTYSVSIQDTIGCVTNKNINYIVWNYPNVKLGNDTGFCPSSTVKIGSGAWGSAYDIMWSNGSTSDSIAVNTSGTYIQTVKAKAAGCGSADTINIQVYTMPQSTIVKGSSFYGTYNSGTISDPDKICTGNSYIYEIMPPSGFTNTQYGSKWGFSSSPFVSTISGANKPSVTLSNPSSGINGSISFTASSSYADSILMIVYQIQDLTTKCDTIITRYVKVTATPKPNLGNAMSLCSGHVFNLDAGYSSPNYAVLWSTGDTGRYLYPKTTATYTAIVSNTSGCKDSSSVYISLNGTGPSGINIQKGVNYQGAFNNGTSTNPDEVCLGNSLDYTVSSPSLYTKANYGTKWRWTSAPRIATASGYSPSVGAFQFSYPSTSQNGSFTFATTGTPNDSTYIVSINIKDSFTGCDTTIYRYIHVSNSLHVNLGTDKNYCATSVILDAGYSGNFTYKWNTNDTTQQLKVISSGTYSVFVSDPLGCKGSDTITVNLNPPKPRGVSISIGSVFNGVYNNSNYNNPDEVCVGSEIRYKISPPKGYTNSNYNTNWTFLNTPFLQTVSGQTPQASSIVFYPPSATNNAELSFTPTLSDTGLVYILTATIKDSLTYCDTSVVCYIKVYDKVNTNFGPDTTICDGKPITLDAGKAKNYMWNTGDTVQKITVNASGLYSVLATGYGYCLATDSIDVKIYKSTTANFNYTLQSSINPRAIQFNPIDTTQTNYHWDFGDIATSAQISPLHIYSVDGNFSPKLSINANTPCFIQSSQNIVINTGIVSPKYDNNFTLYPNPTTGKVYISHLLYNTGMLNISVYDQTGKLLMSQQKQQVSQGKGETEILFPETYSEGLYLIRVTFNNEIYNSRLVKLR